MGRVRKVLRWLGDRPWVVTVVVIVAGTVIVIILARQERETRLDQFEKERIAEDASDEYRQCLATNERREQIIEAIEVTNKNLGHELGATEEEINSFNRRNRDDIGRQFPPRDCERMAP